jgi:hypothetical protein
MKCFEKVLQLRDQGMSLIVVAHAIAQLQRISNRAIVLDRQQMIFDGAFDEGARIYQSALLQVEAEQKVVPPFHDARLAEIKIVEPPPADGGWQTGDCLTVEIEVRCQSPLANACVRLFVKSPGLGILGGFANHATGFRCDLSPPVTRFRVQLQNLPLLMGAYSIGGTLYGPGPWDYCDRLEPGAKFHVVGPATDPNGFGVDGTIQFSHRWLS